MFYTHHPLSVGGLQKQPLDVQRGVIPRPELMVAGQRGVVSNNSLHLGLGTCRQHTQQNCGQTGGSELLFAASHINQARHRSVKQPH